MKIKHLKHWLQQTTALAQLSECTRRKFGCLIVDPRVNCLVIDGYNGAARGGHRLCGGDDVCMREAECIPSGERLARGCNHAEANAIANASRRGVALEGCWLMVNGEPCLACAKLIHQAGITKVVFIGGVYSSSEGVDYLRRYMPAHYVDIDDITTLEEVLT
jgi:dCMP deaminase